MLSDQEIHEVLAAGQAPQEAVDRLIELANLGGGPDNITCVVADVVDGEEAVSDDGPVVVGWVFASHQVGAAIAAVGAGAVRDIQGTYDLAWFLAGGLCVVAALLSLAIRPIRDPGQLETRR